MADTKEAQPEDVPDTIFSRIAKGDVQGVSQILTLGEVKVDQVDEHGMTPLQHAAYRGNEQMCQMLLDRVCNSA